MKNAYSQNGAQRLIPLIAKIHQEIRERSEAIRDLNIRLRQQRDASSSSSELQAALLNLHAELAIHKREIRLAKKELSRLGCHLDEENPFRVLIRGVDGEFESGFAWSPGEERLQTLAQSGPTEAA
jgi:hypothetical protein